MPPVVVPAARLDTPAAVDGASAANGSTLISSLPFNKDTTATTTAEANAAAQPSTAPAVGGPQPNDRQRMHDEYISSSVNAVNALADDELAFAAASTSSTSTTPTSSSSSSASTSSTPSADICSPWSMPSTAADLDTSALSNNSSSSSRDYVFAWSVATQKGYRYEDAQKRHRKSDIHTEMEDFHFPSHTDSPSYTHRISGKPFQVFMLADGHGGHACAQHAIQSIPAQVIELVHSRNWNLFLEQDRLDLTDQLETLFLTADDAYCQRKLAQFHEWIHHDTLQFDPRDRTRRPSDDGCTLVANILYQGFLINCNVGDSRTLLLRRSRHPEKNPGSSHWEPCFASLDHTPGHPAKASHIHANGGRFIYNGLTARVDDLIAKLKHARPDETELLLARCRIGRQQGWRIEELDFPASTTLNLTGTMGDMFFKYDPPLITAQPDVSFQLLEFESPTTGSAYEYMMVMASDGVWDHMVHSIPDVQHSMVANYVDSTMEYADVEQYGFLLRSDGQNADQEPMAVDENSNNSESSNNNNLSDGVHHKLQRLGIMAHGLCDREMLVCDSQLFARGFTRYDDVTAFVVLIQGVAEVQAASDSVQPAGPAEQQQQQC